MEKTINSQVFTSASFAQATIFCSSFKFLEMIIAMVTGSSWKRSCRQTDDGCRLERVNLWPLGGGGVSDLQVPLDLAEVVLLQEVALQSEAAVLVVQLRQQVVEADGGQRVLHRHRIPDDEQEETTWRLRFGREEHRSSSFSNYRSFLFWCIFHPLLICCHSNMVFYNLEQLINIWKTVFPLKFVAKTFSFTLGSIKFQGLFSFLTGKFKHFKVSLQTFPATNLGDKNIKMNLKHNNV